MPTQKVLKIKYGSNCIPCRTRLTEKEGEDLLNGKSVMITNLHRMRGGKLTKDQAYVDLYLPKETIEKLQKKGDNYHMKVSFLDPDADECDTVVKYLTSEDNELLGGSFFRRLGRGLKKAGKFAYKIGKKIAKNPIVSSFANELIGQVPGLKTAIDAGKDLLETSQQVKLPDKNANILKPALGQAFKTGQAEAIKLAPGLSDLNAEFQRAKEFGRQIPLIGAPVVDKINDITQNVQSKFDGFTNNLTGEVLGRGLMSKSQAEKVANKVLANLKATLVAELMGASSSLNQNGGSFLGRVGGRGMRGGRLVAI